MITVRKASESDLFNLFQFLENAKGVSPYQGISAQKLEVMSTFRYAISNKMARLVVATDGEKIVGAAMAQAQRLWFSGSKKGVVAPMLSFSSDEAGTLLVADLLDWAWSIPAVAVVTLGIAHQITDDRYDVCYTGNGMTKAAHVFTMTKEASHGNRRLRKTGS